jgi:predicted RNA binding protein YcfA (HicA-like mRNA interferase family)
VVVPFHGGETLYPKIFKQVLEAIEEASVEPVRLE